MNKLLSITSSAFAFTALALSTQAATLISYDAGNNYSAEDSDFSRRATQSGSGPYVSTSAFSDSSALSPSSDYTGPTFYGGYQYTSSDLEGYLSRQQIRTYAAGDQIFLQAYKSGGWADTTLTLHGIYLFKQQDFNSGYETGAITLDGINMSWTGYITAGDSEPAAFDGRIVIQTGGAYYVSDAVIDLAQTTGSFAISGSTLDSVQWAVYDPTSSFNFDASSASFNDVSLDNITAVGLYFEEDGWTGSGAGSTSFGLGIKSFEATGSATIPEPEHMGILLGAVCILGMLLRRRLGK
ncbi:MAG: hypothetical protein ACQKBW_03535 [Puniceicoccales bacterium]